MAKKKASNKKVRVAIIGVGNCASSLVQGVEFYKSAEASDEIPGLMHPVLGEYHINDIEFTAAFDVDSDKVGKTCPRPSMPDKITPTSSAMFLRRE